MWQHPVGFDAADGVLRMTVCFSVENSGYDVSFQIHFMDEDSFMQFFDIAGVSNYVDLPGKEIRVDIDLDTYRIMKFGHITEDRWMRIRHDRKTMTCTGDCSPCLTGTITIKRI